MVDATRVEPCLMTLLAPLEFVFVVSCFALLLLCVCLIYVTLGSSLFEEGIVRRRRRRRTTRRRMKWR